MNCEPKIHNINLPKKNEILNVEVPFNDNDKRPTTLSFAKLGFEIPKRLTNAPKEVINAVWN